MYGAAQVLRFRRIVNIANTYVLSSAMYGAAQVLRFRRIVNIANTYVLS